MKGKLLIGGLILSLIGCATSHDFFSISPTATKYSGTWTGQYDQLVATLIVNTNGTGQICQDHIGTARITAIKVLNERLYTQDGSYWKIVPVSNDKFKLNFAIGGGFTIFNDNDLTKISPACKEKFKL